MTHICVSNSIIIGSDNGLSPGRRQAIIWTNAGILSIGPLGTNFNEISIDIHTFHSRKCIWKCRQENGGHFVPAQCVNSTMPLAGMSPSRWVLWSLMISNTYLRSGTIMDMGSANERKRYIVTPPLIDWAQTQNDPCWLVDITENSRRDILILPLMMTSRHVNAFRTTGPLWWIPPVPLGFRRHDAHVTSKCCETRELIRCRLGRHSSASEVALI